MERKRLEYQKKSEARIPTVLPLETLSFLVWLSSPQPSASEFHNNIMNRDKCEGSATNAQSCAKTMKPVNYAKCVHTVNGVTT